MRKCRNWQTSKTKDLVIIAIVWVQVQSSALNNKTGTKQSVWSLSYCSMPKRALNPWFKVSPPARSARGMRSPGPHSPHLPQGFGCYVAGAPWFKVSPPARSARGMRSPGPHSPHLPQGFGCCGAGAHGSKVSAPLRSAQSRHPPDVLRSPLRFGRCRTDVPRTSCNPSSALKWGKLNYTDFAQNCILDQKERTSL